MLLIYVAFMKWKGTEQMNKLCEICDTRNRLGMCNGRDGVFKYCFRKVGSTHRLEETITPFNTLHELYEKCDWLDWIIPETIKLENKSYGSKNNMVLLMGKSENTDEYLPVGFVTANVTENMEEILYSQES